MTEHKPKKLVLTGANGFVGGSIAAQAGQEWEVHSFTRKEIPLKRPGLVSHVFDLTDSTRLMETLREVRPDAVIHSAAIADIDFCESNRQAADAVNVEMTRTVVRGCLELGARLVHLSTDTVFDGERGMYREDDPPGPVNYYAETKVKAEEIVRGEMPQAAIPRLAIVMGFPFMGGGNSFLAKMDAAVAQGREVVVPANEIRTPVDVVTLGRAILELAGNTFQGFVHLSGCDRLNRLDVTLKAAERLGWPRELVKAGSPAAIPGRARRPVDVSLDNSLARRELKTPMLGLDDALSLIIKIKEEFGR